MAFTVRDKTVGASPIFDQITDFIKAHTRLRRFDVSCPRTWRNWLSESWAGLWSASPVPHHVRIPNPPPFLFSNASKREPNPSRQSSSWLMFGTMTADAKVPRPFQDVSRTCRARSLCYQKCSFWVVESSSRIPILSNSLFDGTRCQPLASSTKHPKRPITCLNRSLAYPLLLQQAPQSPKCIRQRLSSNSSEFDSYVDKLTNYVAWLINRYPTKFEQLTACLRTLKIKDIVYETLDTIDNVLWESWEVSDGRYSLINANGNMPRLRMVDRMHVHWFMMRFDYNSTYSSSCCLGMWMWHDRKWFQPYVAWTPLRST